MSKTTWQETFRDSPRLTAIQSVFKLMERTDVTVNEIWAKTSKVMQDLNAEERARLPDLVRAKLVDREPVRVGGPPPML